MVYGYLVFFWRPLVVLEVTAFLAILAVLGILAWIGYTLATTPPPQPIEEIEKELQTEAKKAAGTAPASPPPAQKWGLMGMLAPPLQSQDCRMAAVRRGVQASAPDRPEWRRPGTAASRMPRCSASARDATDGGHHALP
ncbi:MAG: hypothetical protein ABSG92_11020 [Conexivisphaerales archaeon]